LKKIPPENIDDAQYSTPWAVAMALIDGENAGQTLLDKQALARESSQYPLPYGDCHDFTRTDAQSPEP
jgi:2-methylcitrate dehydratase PrpD